MVKERLTITLDRKILDEVDSTIDGINIRNRSHAIEYLLEESLGKNMPQKAVILAGGSLVKGPNGYVPKPMLMIDNKPLIEYLIRMLVKNEIKDILILAGDKGNMLTTYFGDGSKYGVRITYLIEEKRSGTEGALAFAKGLLNSESFFVINGDNYYDFNVKGLCQQHAATKALVTIALTTAENTKSFGVTKLEGSKILNFTENPNNETSKLVSSGFYLFSKEALDFVNSGSEPVMLEKSLFPLLASMGKLYGFVVSGNWVPLSSENIEMSIKSMEIVVSSAYSNKTKNKKSI
ncbi:MAG: sugar phosphate nucleotidyltransferase [Candidatus Micrarchaeia archaeon]